MHVICGNKLSVNHQQSSKLQAYSYNIQWRRQNENTRNNIVFLRMNCPLCLLTIFTTPTQLQVQHNSNGFANHNPTTTDHLNNNINSMNINNKDNKNNNNNTTTMRTKTTLATNRTRTTKQNSLKTIGLWPHRNYPSL